MYIVKTLENFDIVKFKCLDFHALSFSKKQKSRHCFGHFLLGFFAYPSMCLLSGLARVCFVLSCLIENCAVCMYTKYRISVSVHRTESTTSNILLCWMALDFIEIPNFNVEIQAYADLSLANASVCLFRQLYAVQMKPRMGFELLTLMRFLFVVL